MTGVGRERTIAILGGGISGLVAAESITRHAGARGAPIRAIVLEAERSAGGKIQSERAEGFVLDSGPHGFLDREPEVFALVDRLGLRGSLVPANAAAAKRFIVRAGKLREVPSSPPAFLASDILPLGAKLRVLREPFAASRPPGDESVLEFASRRIGRVAAEVLVDAMVTGIYGGDPARLSLASAFPRMRELEDQYGGLIRAQLAIAREKKARGEVATGGAGTPAGTMYTFREGLGELTRALARRAEVRLEHRATSLRRDGAEWVVETTGGSVRADAVISTLPAFESAALLAPFAPDEARVIAEIPYAPIAVIVQAYPRASFGHPLDGFGFLVPFVESRRILGSIWASSVFPVHVPGDAVMLRTMIGGRRRPELLELDDTALLAAARDELRVLLGVSLEAPPVLERVIRWPRGIPQYDVGHAARVEAASALERRLPGVFLGGNGFRGVAMIGCVVDAERVADRAVSGVVSREHA